MNLENLAYFAIGAFVAMAIAACISTAELQDLRNEYSLCKEKLEDCEHLNHILMIEADSKSISETK